jgi:hypothetical protein
MSSDGFLCYLKLLFILADIIYCFNDDCYLLSTGCYSLLLDSYFFGGLSSSENDDIEDYGDSDEMLGVFFFK